MKTIFSLAIFILIASTSPAQTTKFFSIQKANEVGIDSLKDKLNYSINGSSSLGLLDVDAAKINNTGGVDLDFLIWSKLKKKAANQKLQIPLFVENDTKSTVVNYHQLWSNIYGSFNTFNSDSAILQKIIFNESGKTSFGLSLNYSWSRQKHSNKKILIGTSFDYQYKIFKKEIFESDSTKIQIAFNNPNYLLSFPCFISYPQSTVPISIGFIPNLAWHNIANEDTSRISKMYGGDFINRGIFSFGARFEIILNNKVAVFFDFKKLFGIRAQQNVQDKYYSDYNYNRYQHNFGVNIRAAAFTNKSSEDND